MNLRLLNSFLSFTLLSLLTALFVALPSSHAVPQAPQSEDASVSEMRSRAEKGDAVAQYKLAQFFLRSIFSAGVSNGSNNGPTSEDYESALKWLLASKAQGNASAEFLLGYMYEHGKGVPQDYAKAEENYRAAALQNYSSAENNLAALYHHGKGVPKNVGKAFEWYLSSARHGNPVAQCNLATLYYEGSGVPRDYKEAVRWFRAAADLGYAQAQNNLAVSYYRGLGVAPDRTETARWLRLAAQQGMPLAEANLAFLYEHGNGVPLDYVAAYTWYSRSLAAGYTPSAEHRKQLSHLMSRKQIDEATSLLTTASYQPQQPPSALDPGAFSLLQNH